MDTYNDNWCSCLLFRNKQLTKELKRFEDFSTLSGSSSRMLALSQLLKLHLTPAYGIIRNEYEWQNLFAVIDLLYGDDWLPADLEITHLSLQELKLCYLEADIVGEEHYRVARKVQSILQRYQELQDIIAILEIGRAHV